MSAIRYQPHYTIADYLQWQGDWELWDGYAVSMSPSPSFTHQRIASRLLFQLAQALQDNDDCGECQVVYGIDWHVDNSTVVRPDLLILCGEAPTDWVKRPPVLIAEILSPSTRDKDLTAKRDLYSEQGVQFYLLADPETNELTVLQLDGETYQNAPSRTLELHPGCQVTIEELKSVEEVEGS